MLALRARILPQFDQQHVTVFGIGRMARAVRIKHKSPFEEVAMFIAEGAVEHENLLTFRMPVFGKLRARIESN